MRPHRCLAGLTIFWATCSPRLWSSPHETGGQAGIAEAQVTSAVPKRDQIHYYHKIKAWAQAHPLNAQGWHQYGLAAEQMAGLTNSLPRQTGFQWESLNAMEKSMEIHPSLRLTSDREHLLKGIKPLPVNFEWLSLGVATAGTSAIYRAEAIKVELLNTRFGLGLGISLIGTEYCDQWTRRGTRQDRLRGGLMTEVTAPGSILKPFFIHARIRLLSSEPRCRGIFWPPLAGKGFSLNAFADGGGWGFAGGSTSSNIRKAETGLKFEWGILRFSAGYFWLDIGRIDDSRSTQAKGNSEASVSLPWGQSGGGGGAFLSDYAISIPGHHSQGWIASFSLAPW